MRIVVIRSHGVGKHIYDLLEAHHITVVDATCPFVKKIHRIVEKQTGRGAPRHHHRKSGTPGGAGHPRMGK